MDPIHIHNLLRQIANGVKCPHCTIKVRPDMIVVENSSQNYCLLKIQCYKCHEIFHGHAHVGVKVVHPQQKFASLEGNNIFNEKLPPSPRPITEEDIINVQNVFASNGASFSQLFQK